jgi:glutaminyl-tRNA synthetase
MPENDGDRALDFVRAIVEEDNRTGRYGGRVHTRFPPEPNGYLHIGHAKAINLNYSLAEEYGGLFNLRFDDTNPMAEEEEFVESIAGDIKWLGYDWDDRLYFASDYFEQLYEYARQLIKMGKAYVCDLTPEETAEYRGTIHEPGRPSPFRNRSVDENLDLFAGMRDGEFDDGSRTLRARIDMASPNMLMRDPVIYRILHVAHHRTGDAWAIYPMYDFAHPLSDSIEGITHSNCSIEFESHRPLYDWYLDQLGVHHPRQTEFARLNLTKTVLSKRRLRRLVEGGHVEGWDDPRMPTIAGLRRRGYTPEAIRDFLSRVGVAKTPTTIEIELLEHCLRDHLNRRANRVMAVLDPVRVVIENYPEGKVEEVEAINNPEDESAGTRMLPFSRTVLIERSDFMEDPPKKFFRLAPGREVRLKHGYLVTCTDVVKDAEGRVAEIRCTYDPASRGGDAPDGRRVRGTLHWVSEEHALEAEVRLYDHLLIEPTGEGEHELEDLINPESLVVMTGARVEPSLRDAGPGKPYQFLRKGYFTRDPGDGLVFNRSVALKDTWAKIVKARRKG